MKRLLLLVFSGCFLFFLSTITKANVIRVPTDQPTIQDALDNAETGDAILVAPGTYSGEKNRNLNFNGKALSDL